MAKIRGNKISIIFQDPMTSLNPTHTIGHQLTEAILLHTGRNKKQAKERAVEMLRLVNINEPEKRMKQYPHELSGGMRQRAALLRTYMFSQKVALLDEPFSALDQTLRQSMRKEVFDLQKELGWEPSLQFEEGIEKTVRWYLDNQEWMDNIISGDYEKYYDDMYKNR